jgi:phosphoribosylaminoimidazole carboxylase PurE protein
MSAIVGVIMGSDSDLQVMSDACRVLEELDIEFETTIVSAHRTPQRMYEYAKNAFDRGLRVIIAGAGGAAHLPGMVAAMTDIPVIGVPVPAGNLEGLDSLLSIVQMPRGVPVATVAINNSRNAGLLAARILGTSDEAVRARVAAYRADAESEVVSKAQKLEGSGYLDYLSEMGHRNA